MVLHALLNNVACTPKMVLHALQNDVAHTPKMVLHALLNLESINVYSSKQSLRNKRTGDAQVPVRQVRQQARQNTAN